MDDRALLRACLDGQGQAWEEFVNRFSRLIYWSIRKTLSTTEYNRQDVIEEIFQETFEKLLSGKELGRLKELTGLRKYLAVIASHATLDKLKALRRAATRFLGDEGVVLVGDDSPSQDILKVEEADRLRKALEGLSFKERTCLELHYVDGRTHREISALLGMPQDTVSTLIRRTKEKLRGVLGE